MRSLVLLALVVTVLVVFVSSAETPAERKARRDRLLTLSRIRALRRRKQLEKERRANQRVEVKAVTRRPPSGSRAVSRFRRPTTRRRTRPTRRRGSSRTRTTTRRPRTRTRGSSRTRTSNRRPRTRTRGNSRTRPKPRPKPRNDFRRRSSRKRTDEDITKHIHKPYKTKGCPGRRKEKQITRDEWASFVGFCHNALGNNLQALQDLKEMDRRGRLDRNLLRVLEQNVCKDELDALKRKVAKRNQMRREIKKCERRCKNKQHGCTLDEMSPYWRSKHAKIKPRRRW